MELPSETEVVVVGAGPVGMVAAACLARRGVRTAIVEQGYRPAARSYALALHPSSLAILDELGLAKPLIEKGKIVDTVVFYEGEEERARLALGELRTEFPFTLVVPQSILEETLAKHLKAQGTFVLWNLRGAEVRIGKAMADVTVQRLASESAGYGALPSRAATAPTADLHSFFVIGADGYRSTVRQALGIDYREVGASQTFGVFELEAAWNPEQELRVVLEPSASSVLWPLGRGRLRWSFELRESEVSSPRLKRRLLVQMGEEAFPYIAQELLEDLIAERAPWFVSPVRNVTWSVAVNFERRLVPSFGRDSAWLVGDAAHLAGPVGVHSMNVGFREASDLAGNIHAILHEGAARSVLQEYEAERLAEWKLLLGLGGEPRAAEGADEWVAANASRIVESIPASGEDLRELAAQVGLDV